jgi:hypothetical protein
MKLFLLAILATVIIAFLSEPASSRQSEIEADEIPLQGELIPGKTDSLNFTVDSLSMKPSHTVCGDIDLKTPVIKPDDRLSSSMPQLKGEILDEEIFIPRFKKCEEDSIRALKPDKIPID